MDTYQGKAWYRSRTVWSVAIMMLAGIIKSANGKVFSEESQSQAVDLILTAIEALSGVAAIYFRGTATQRIT